MSSRIFCLPLQVFGTWHWARPSRIPDMTSPTRHPPRPHSCPLETGLDQGGAALGPALPLCSFSPREDVDVPQDSFGPGPAPRVRTSGFMAARFLWLPAGPCLRAAQPQHQLKTRRRCAAEQLWARPAPWVHNTSGFVAARLLWLWARPCLHAAQPLLQLKTGRRCAVERLWARPCPPGARHFRHHDSKTSVALGHSCVEIITPLMSLAFARARVYHVACVCMCLHMRVCVCVCVVCRPQLATLHSAAPVGSSTALGPAPHPKTFLPRFGPPLHRDPHQPPDPRHEPGWRSSVLWARPCHPDRPLACLQWPAATLAPPGDGRLQSLTRRHSLPAWEHSPLPRLWTDLQPNPNWSLPRLQIRAPLHGSAPREAMRRRVWSPFSSPPLGSLPTMWSRAR